MLQSVEASSCHGDVNTPLSGLLTSTVIQLYQYSMKSKSQLLLCQLSVDTPIMSSMRRLTDDALTVTFPQVW